MNCPFTRFTVILLLIFSGQIGFYATAQEKSYHVFTDKKGQMIEAALLTITPDKTKLGIQRKDGRKFEIPILNLSLNDQQFIKNWLKGNPIKSDYKLDVTFENHLVDKTRIPVPNNDLKWLTETITMEIKVKNRSRANLSGASLEYYIIIAQGVYASIMDPESQQTYGMKEWWYSNAPGQNFKRKKNRMRAFQLPLRLIHGKEEMEDLAYNFSKKFTSEPFPLREISQSGARDPKDTVLGVIVRITDENGNEVDIYRSSNKLLELSWDEISRMPPGDPSGSPQMDESN